MRALIQRVRRASVSVDGEVIGSIDAGLVVFAGVHQLDTRSEAEWLAEKIAHLRIFGDAQGKFNLSLLDTGGSVLLVSQFTLYGDARRGRRPSFTEAARPEVAEPLIVCLGDELLRQGVRNVAMGRFQAHMLVEILNDGPVTISLDTGVTRSGGPRQSGTAAG